MEQVKHSPDIDTDMPVSRQREAELYQYYQWPYYWVGNGLWGPTMWPDALTSVVMPDNTDKQATAKTPTTESSHSHLRSVLEVGGYRIQARDGEIGHVADFLLDDATWSLRALVVDTGSWLHARKVILPITAVESVKWEERAIHVTLSQEDVRHSPVYGAGVGESG
jgi:hypothetical protein